MSYNALETSAFGGTPVECYFFQNGGNIWRYTSADDPITINGITYAPDNVQRNAIMESQEVNKNNLQLTVPRNNKVAQLYWSYPPSSLTSLSIFRRHRSDTEFVSYWMGRIISSEFAGPTATLSCEPVSTSVKRLGLFRHYQRECPHILYGANCKANRAAFALGTPLTNKNYAGALTLQVGNTLVVDSYAGGMVSWETDNGTQFRFVTGNSASEVYINFPLLPDTDTSGRACPIGTTLMLYPGCQHTMTDCINKFNNLVNYGGFPYIPLANPFTGMTLF